MARAGPTLQRLQGVPDLFARWRWRFVRQQMLSDGAQIAIGKHLLAEKMYMAECRLEIKS